MRTGETSHLIGGKPLPSTGPDIIEVIDPTTEGVIGNVAAGTSDDVDAAVGAAVSAFDEWAARSPSDRASYLTKVSEGIMERQDELAELLARELGAPLEFARVVHVGKAAAFFDIAAEVLLGYEFDEPGDSFSITREPVGVVGTITPWNYPVHQLSCKVAPALAAGCVVVAKPSELTPLSSLVLAEIVDESGMPSGVFNLVQGRGDPVGEAIALHADIDMVSFTGSTAVGTRVAQLAATTVKRIGLELGGKSANILLRDADFEVAVPNGVAACFVNSGQTCSALTKMLVPRERLAEVEELARVAAAGFTLGKPFDAATRLGPLVSSAQRDRVRDDIVRGVEEGARLIIGGPEQPENLPVGYFVKPTVFSGVTPSMAIAREEIFGPVLSIMAYDSEDEAVDMANDSVYGLAGGVWSLNAERARATASRLRTGQVAINGAMADPRAPFGGYKQSGFGRERGVFGFEEFLEIKAILNHTG